MEGNWIFGGLQLLIIIQLLPFLIEGNLQDKYIGCYYDDGNDQTHQQKTTLQDNTTLTIEWCIGQCLLQRSTYAGLENSKACLCGEDFGVSSPDASCHSLCIGNQSEYCGGSNGQITFYSIYAVCEIGYYGNMCDQVCHCKGQAPCNRMTGKCPKECEDKWFGTTCSDILVSEKYIGCFRDNGTVRAINQNYTCGVQQLTVESCSNSCALRNNSIAGLQDGHCCFCGESYTRYGPLGEDICSRPCIGNGLQYCGGPLANSVYSVCPAGYYGRNCHNQCHCYNNSRCVYLTGECNSTCKAGWTGSSCNIRDCKTENGACFQNETCAIVNLNFATITGCRCLTGFERRAFQKICLDTDECKRGFCDASTTDCTNTIGSYKCTCKPGYQHYNDNICYDVDECASKTHNCYVATEECNNTNGSFFCTCKKGFQRMNETCEDVDECISSPCGNSVPCSNTQGSFECNKGSNAGTIAGAVVGSILGVALIVGIVLIVLFLYRRRQPKKLVNQLDELPSSSQEILLPDRVVSIYGDGPNTYEVIQPTTGNSLQTLRKKLSDPDGIKQEFQSVDLQTKDFCALGTMVEVKKKNRFINIIPYEYNRVILSNIGDDDTSQYINASYVQGYNDATKFIATQGPREETIDDFWRMIFENRVHLIVMITNLVESQKKKCEQYWPELGHPVVYGDITVTLSSEESWPDYTVRCLRCSNKSSTVELKQLHYLSWPDHGVPYDIKGFLTFRQMVRKRMNPEKYTVVHCSAGAGRTGAFIAIDYLLEQEQVEHDIKILDCLKRLRDQRSQMIQNLAQYVFVHNALLLAFEIGDTVIPITQFLSKYKQLQTKDEVSGKSTLEKQFQFIEQVNIDSEETDKYRVYSDVVAQHKMDDMSPVFVQTWKMKDAYIAAQSIDSFTYIWELIKERNCSVMVFLGPIPDSEDSFFPTMDKPITMGNRKLHCEGITKEEYGSRYTVSELKELEEDTTYANTGSSEMPVYQNTGSTSSKIKATVLHVTKSIGKGLEDATRLLSVYNIVSSLTSKGKDSPIMVVSSDCSLSGFCLAAFNAFEMMKQEGVIDLYQIVLNIRKSRTELFNSMESYVNLHNVVERYIVMSNA